MRQKRQGASTLLVLAGLLGLSVCAQPAAASPGRHSPTVGVEARASHWPANRMFQSTAVTEHGRTRHLVPGTHISLSFGPATRRGSNSGGVNAHAGCNQMSGQGRLVGGRLVIGALASTRMACSEPLMAQDQWLASVLTGRPYYHLTGHRLTLRLNATVIKLVEVTQEPLLR
jgi:heat shock protein HslJ